MSQVSKVALFLVVFFLGCAAERLVVPPARAGAPSTRWEYVCRTERGDEDVTTMANEFGAQGWELTAAGTKAYEATWCFKRPLP
jgi:hypothetical protein